MKVLKYFMLLVLTVWVVLVCVNIVLPLHRTDIAVPIIIFIGIYLTFVWFAFVVLDE